MLSIWIYTSRALIASRSADEGALYLRARANNRRDGVTGHLHRARDRYAQVIEGDPETVDALRARIARDWRHDGIFTLREGPVLVRTFETWDMGYGDGGRTPPRLLAAALARPTPWPGVPTVPRGRRALN
ncbi:BLUF domain-containing protein [Jannaschia sp. Os4]|uniref:BLUF domain-containing protein n=1 Tax=Jannaschia sp. Os4 TaxID=2807617 RepID=UPI00193A81CA|nr:BLUF domain-containing protein [Jannaschia sp. Os4]MBM2576763.1 BLUF domain-containing protein [Jannaschia sp. Os4]